MKIEKIEKKITEILEKRGPIIKKNKKNNDYDFIKNGHVDSVGFVKFILELETNFKIDIPNRLFYSKKISSVKGLASIIKRLLK
jgi:acyl carrier protein